MKAKRLPSADRRAQIANVAAALFAKKGFNGATTREIAKKAKVNEAILFRHFPTKDALYTEIINQKIHIKPEIFDTSAIKKGDDAEVFRNVARHFIKQIEEDNTFLRLMLFSALEDHKLASLFFKERIHVIFNFLSGYIARRVNEGAFKPVEPKIAIRAFIGMFFHFILLRELFDVPRFLHVSKNEAVEKFVGIFLEGLKI